MDRFVCGEPGNFNAKDSGADLLQLMKKSGHQENRPPASSSSRTAPSSGWENRNLSVTATLLTCSDRNRTLNKDVKGWRVIDGQKTYTTFRNGKIVRATGFAGYNLSIADNSNGKDKKRQLDSTIESCAGASTAEPKRTSAEAIEAHSHDQRKDGSIGQFFKRTRKES